MTEREGLLRRVSEFIVEGHAAEATHALLEALGMTRACDQCDGWGQIQREREITQTDPDGREHEGTRIEEEQCPYCWGRGQLVMTDRGWEPPSS